MGRPAGELDPAVGRVLVASPVIGDATFYRTVVLLLEHDDESGTLGVVLNRPTELPVAEAIPTWGRNLSPPGVLFTGGPVAEGSALGLALLEADDVAIPAGLTSLFGPLAVVDLDGDPLELTTVAQALRIYSGYAGWGAGQLRGELRGGAWWVFDSLPEDWFSTSPQDLWSAVLRRQGGHWTMWAHAPDDPEVN